MVKTLLHSVCATILACWHMHNYKYGKGKRGTFPLKVSVGWGPGARVHSYVSLSQVPGSSNWAPGWRPAVLKLLSG